MEAAHCRSVSSRYNEDEKEEDLTEPVQDVKEERPGRERREGWDEKWRRDPADAVVWALILIWVGVLLLAENAGIWTKLLGEDGQTWSVGFVGAGLIVLLGVILRLVAPAYRRPVTGSIIFGIILLAIGLGELTNWAVIGAVALIVVGVVALFGGLFRKR
jgi:hypothetical protein